MSPGTLLVWIQAQVEPYNLQVQCVPRKWFGSAVCVQRDRQPVYNIVSQSADPNQFRGTAGEIRKYVYFFSGAATKALSPPPLLLLLLLLL